MRAGDGRQLRRALGAVLCCAGLVAAGVLGSTDGQPMPPDPGGAAVHGGLAGGTPVPVGPAGESGRKA